MAVKTYREYTSAMGAALAIGLVLLLAVVGVVGVWYVLSNASAVERAAAAEAIATAAAAAAAAAEAKAALELEIVQRDAAAKQRAADLAKAVAAREQSRLDTDPAVAQEAAAAAAKVAEDAAAKQQAAEAAAAAAAVLAAQKAEAALAAAEATAAAAREELGSGPRRGPSHATTIPPGRYRIIVRRRPSQKQPAGTHAVLVANPSGATRGRARLTLANMDEADLSNPALDADSQFDVAVAPDAVKGANGLAPPPSVGARGHRITAVGMGRPLILGWNTNYDDANTNNTSKDPGAIPYHQSRSLLVADAGHDGVDGLRPFTFRRMHAPKAPPADTEHVAWGAAYIVSGTYAFKHHTAPASKLRWMPVNMQNFASDRVQAVLGNGFDRPGSYLWLVPIYRA
jgi:hypothetical protein